ncbi:MAG: hypothetical protein KAJ51_01400, partial [Thermoplasmata archaeon]|nr:hypothetical protein [Thermoplasmata archaeon]
MDKMKFAIFCIIILLATIPSSVVVVGNTFELDDLKSPELLFNTKSNKNVEKFMANAPIAFTTNYGQLENDEVRFYAQGGGVWFADDG